MIIPGPPATPSEIAALVRAETLATFPRRAHVTDARLALHLENLRATLAEDEVDEAALESFLQRAINELK